MVFVCPDFEALVNDLEKFFYRPYWQMGEWGDCCIFLEFILELFFWEGNYCFLFLKNGGLIVEKGFS